MLAAVIASESVKHATDDTLAKRTCAAGALDTPRNDFVFHKPVRQRKPEWDTQWDVAGRIVGSVHHVGDRSFAPYYVPSSTCSTRGSVPTFPKREVSKQYWEGNPSLHWAAPEEDLIDMDNEHACRNAITTQGFAKGTQKHLNSNFFGNPNLYGLAPQCYQYWRYMPSLSQLFSLHSAAASNFGQNFLSTGLLFAGADRQFMDFVMTAVPAAKTFLEFGTASGITSVYLGTAAGMRGGTLTTIDIHDARSPQAKAVWNDRYMRRIYADLLLAASTDCRPFSCVAANQTVIQAVAAADIWLIDNGIKDKETFLYARHAPIGCIAVVHDMTMDRTQFDLFDQPFRFYGYQPIFTDLAMSMGSHLRAWVRTKEKVAAQHEANLREPPQVFPRAGGFAR